MGDRNNPIKFGPEWLRNLPRERRAISSSPTSQAANSGSGTGAGPGSSGPGNATVSNKSNANASCSGASNNRATNSNGSNTANNNATVDPRYPGITSKFLLAKLRYGREEMLALYDRNAEAPPELKSIDAIYQPRGKQPVALNNTFEDEMRDNMRSAPPIGGMSSTDRYGLGRGSGRGGMSDGRGRSRGGGYTRPSASTGRGAIWNVTNPRLPSYSGSAEDEGSPMRSWTNNSVNNRNNVDQTEWANKMYRSKRQGGTNTNWRQQQSRDEGGEWRSSEPGRSRQGEKWERDRGDRPSGEKSQGWITNRRTWGGSDSQNEENLPEWAADNAECSGGTFDSSGAFHGYSNDDSNLPKNQETSHPLTRSHTHGSFVRSKTVEEGSDEWWASEKAKKLSPKRFDASEIKFNKIGSETQSISLLFNLQQGSVGSAEGDNKASGHKEECSQESLESPDSVTAPEPPESNNTQKEDNYAGKNIYKTFDAMMRSDINMDMDEANDERGNFQSVIITPNNSLRQKHQHIVPASDISNKNIHSNHNIKQSQTNSSKHEMDHGSHKSPEDILVDKIFGMAIDEKEMLSTSSANTLLTLSNSGMPTGLASPGSSMPHQNVNMQMNKQNSVMGNQGLSMEANVNKQNMQASGMQAAGRQTPGMQSGHTSGKQTPGMQSSGLLQSAKQTGMHNTGMAQHGIPNTVIQNSGVSQAGMSSSGIPSGMQNAGLSSSAMQAQGMSKSGLQNQLPSGINPNTGMPNSVLQNPGMPSPRGQAPPMQSSVMQMVGMNNTALNASLGLPLVPGANMGSPLQNVSPAVFPNTCVANNMGASMGASGMQNAMATASLQAAGSIPGYQTGGVPGMSNANVGNNSLFLQNTNNSAMSTLSDIPMPKHATPNNMFPMHGLQHSASLGGFGNSIYSNNATNLSEQWYYEDPKRNIQGPFSSKDMYNWYRAGFFTPSLMVRRACETNMRPLCSYGPGVPFAVMDMLPPYPMSGGFDTHPQSHDRMLNSQTARGLDVMKMNVPDIPPAETVQFGSVGQMGIQSFNQPQPMTDVLWGQSTNDLMWMQQPLNTRNDARVNNLPMFFWDQQDLPFQPSAIASNSLLPEEITKEMKTEDQILAQLRASQNIGPPLSFIEQPAAITVATTVPDDRFAAAINATPNLEELHRLIQKDTLTVSTPVIEPEETEPQPQPKPEKVVKPEPTTSEPNVTKSQAPAKTTAESKPAKQTDKTTKNKENNNTKNKSKKTKDEKKDDTIEVKSKDDEVSQAEKRSQEPSPPKNKKEDKSNKKELEREKKEWIKEGFTIVKGPEKTTAKDCKKKAEEARAAEEAERKRKEEEKLAAEVDKKKKQTETHKKQQEQAQQQQSRPASETVAKKAPWSAIANLSSQSVNRDGPTLAEIQRLEREKKLEQMKEQQQMMQIIAQQQAVALAREQEMQAGLGWAKKKGNNFNTLGQSLAEIQAEARKQAAAAAAAAAAAQAQAFEEAQAAAAPQTNHVPWTNSHNGGGFWDTQPNQPSKPEKPQEPPKPAAEVTKPKKKVSTAPKKEASPAVEFENWCTSFLTAWSSKIDVPTFVGFLKDIESPYEVKDYVKCYLGDSKDSNDFARQFLERRSKLLRVGMVTPSDDLCSPAMAINPRTISGSDYQEVKGKGKKTKKNKMLKIDARILGFSVTAAEDRINVGDIDTV